MDKIVAEEDMKDEAIKLIAENNEVVGEFFAKHETIMKILKYILLSSSFVFVLFCTFRYYFHNTI
jgi:hypothetical protein